MSFFMAAFFGVNISIQVTVKRQILDLLSEFKIICRIMSLIPVEIVKFDLNENLLSSGV